MKKSLLILSLVCFAGSGFVGGDKKALAAPSAELYGQPAVIAEITDESALNSLKNGSKPDSALLYINSKLKVVDSSSKTMGDLNEVITDKLDGIIPILFVKDTDTVKPLTDILKTAPITDLAVTSDNLAVLGELSSLKQECKMRLFYYTKEDLSEVSSCVSEISKATMFGSQVIIAGGKISKNAVDYIQGRALSVWVKSESDKVSVAKAVTSGAYGVITSMPETVYSVLSDIASFAKEGKVSRVLTRIPQIVAHRGLAVRYTENTVNAVKAAAELGAMAVEIDIRLTKDKQIVLLHDDSVQYAMINEYGTPASGTVSGMTLAELRNLKMKDGESQIATLDDIFTLAKTDVCKNLNYIIEIKGQEPELITKFSEKIDEYGLSSKIVVISFYPNQIMNFRGARTDIPTLLLQYTTDGETAIKSAESLGSGIDMQFNGSGGLPAFYGNGNTADAYATCFKYFAARGYSLWLWTYEYDTMAEALRYGVTGVTTNDPVTLSPNCITKLMCEGEVEVDKLPEDGGTIKVNTLNIKGEIKEVTANVRYIDKENNVALIVYEPESNYGLVSEPVALKAANNSASGNCSNCNSSVSGGMLLALMLPATALLLKNRRKDK